MSELTLNEIHFNLYSKLAYDLINYALSRKNIYSNHISRDKILQYADKEIVYAEKYWNNFLSDPHTALKYKRMIVTSLRYLLLRTVCFEKISIGNSTCLTTAQIRKCPAEVLKKRHPFEYKDYSENKSIVKNDFSLEELAYLIDVIGCYKARKKVDEEYSEEVVKSINGVPANPFIKNSIESMLSEIENLEKEREIKIEALYTIYIDGAQSLRKEYGNKIIELQEQIKQLKANA